MGWKKKSKYGHSEQRCDVTCNYLRYVRKFSVFLFYYIINACDICVKGFLSSDVELTGIVHVMRLTIYDILYDSTNVSGSL